jgi:hypothetical protein
MATDVERLIAVMEVNARKYERDMARATQVTDTKLREIERKFTDPVPGIDGPGQPAPTAAGSPATTEPVR